MKWQTIETAPKDRTVILIYGENEVSVAFWQVRAGIGDWRCLGYGILACDDQGYAASLFHPNPTHWMPLPEPPK